MAKPKKKLVAKSASIVTKIDSGIERLTAAYEEVATAAETRSKENKKLADDVKKHSKKRATLLKRKKIASDKTKKSPSADATKALRTVEKELGSVTKELTKARSEKSTISAELASLKGAERKVNAYMKAIAAVDKLLNKPPKKAKKKPKKKATAKTKIPDVAESSE